MYVDHFQLEQYIRFETEVVSVEQQQDGGGRWSVTTRKMKDTKDTTTETFDAVMVCVGIHSTGNMPTFEGQEEFKGQLIHSINYRQACCIVSSEDPLVVENICWSKKSTKRCFILEQKSLKHTINRVPHRL